MAAICSHTYNLKSHTFIFADPSTPSSKGTRFLVAFMPNTASNRLSEDPIPNAYIVVTTDEEGTVDFSVTTHFGGTDVTTDYNVTCDEPKRINFPADDNLYTTSGSETDKTISVESKMGKRISVYVVSDEVRSTDGYVALPCDGMAAEGYDRYEYIVLSTLQDTLGNPASTSWSSEFVVITCEGNTVVNVRPSTTITLAGVFNTNTFGPGLGAEAANWQVGGSRNIPAENTLTIGLLGDDLTGTVIRGTKPIVVLSGHQCGQVPVGRTACDHMIVQIPPHTTWGYTFLLNPLSERQSGDLYRFATRTDGTQITITCVDAGGSNPTIDYEGTLNSAQNENWGEFQTHDSSSGCVDVPKFCCLQSTNPVVLAQYSYGYTVDQSCDKSPGDLGDPFFSVIPPVVQYLNNYNIFPVDAIASPFTFKYLSVSVHNDFFQPDLITFDDAPLQSDPSQWQAIYCAEEDICGYAYTLEINVNAYHKVQHTSDNAAIFVHVYGYSPQNSFGLAGGMELQLISGQSHISQLHPNCKEIS